MQAHASAIDKHRRVVVFHSMHRPSPWSISSVNRNVASMTTALLSSQSPSRLPLDAARARAVVVDERLPEPANIMDDAAIGQRRRTQLNAHVGP